VVAFAVTIGALAAAARAQPVPGSAASTTAPGGTTVASLPSGARPSDAPIPSGLDETIKDELGRELKPRGVQERDFLKKHKFELLGPRGLYSCDLTSSSYIYGGSLAFFFTEDFGFEGRFDVTRMQVDLDSPLAKFFGESHFKPGKAYLALGNLIWSPIH